MGTEAACDGPKQQYTHDVSRLHLVKIWINIATITVFVWNLICLRTNLWALNVSLILCQITSGSVVKTMMAIMSRFLQYRCHLSHSYHHSFNIPSPVVFAPIDVQKKRPENDVNASGGCSPKSSSSCSQTDVYCNETDSSISQSLNTPGDPRPVQVRASPFPPDAGEFSCDSFRTFLI